MRDTQSTTDSKQTKQPLKEWETLYIGWETRLRIDKWTYLSKNKNIFINEKRDGNIHLRPTTVRRPGSDE